MKECLNCLYQEYICLVIFILFVILVGALVRWIKKHYSKLKEKFCKQFKTLLERVVVITAVFLIILFLWILADDLWLPCNWIGFIQERAGIEPIDTYKGLLTAIGGLAIIWGVAVSLRRAKALEDQVEEQRNQTQEQRNQNKNETFVKAVELLEKKSDASKIGAIYTLHRMAKDDPSYAMQVLETLCGFVRAETKEAWEFNFKILKARNKYKYPAVPVQAAVELIFNSRRYSNAPFESSACKKYPTDLYNIFLDNVQLYGSIILNTQLINAFLRGANMKMVNIEDVLLGYSFLTDAVFTQARIVSTNFIYARLDNTDFTEAFFYRVTSLNQLWHFNPSNVVFTGAVYYDTHFPKDVTKSKLISYENWLANKDIKQLILKHCLKTYTVKEPIAYKCWRAVSSDPSYKGIIERIIQQQQNQ